MPDEKPLSEDQKARRRASKARYKKLHPAKRAAELTEEQRLRRNAAKREYNKGYRKRMHGEQLDRFCRAAAAGSLRYRQRHPEGWTVVRRRDAAKLKLEVMTHYGRVCACCKEDQIEFLAIDHIHGHGAADRLEKTGRKNGSGGVFYRKLRQLGYPEGYRVLCHNCNMAIGCFGYCPHQSQIYEDIREPISA